MSKKIQRELAEHIDIAAGKRKKGLQGGMLLRRQKEIKRKIQTRKGKMKMQTQKSMIQHVESRALSKLNDL